MTIIEAIEKEIEKEKKEIKDLEDDKNALLKKMEGQVDRETIKEMINLLRQILSRPVEIEGKRKLLAVVKADPDNAMRAIEKEIGEEDKKADEIGRKAQALREKAYREEKTDPAGAAKDRAEAKKLGDQHDEELAHLRGKREAERAVRKALETNK